MAKRPAKPRKETSSPPVVPAATLLSSAKSTLSTVHSVKREIMQLHVWIMTAISLLQPIAVGLFDSQGTLPQQPWPFYVAVFKATAPLTIALSLWMIAVVAFWRQENDSAGFLMLMFLIGGLMLIVAAKIGNALGGIQVTIIEPMQHFGPINGFLNALYSYLLAYRGALFVSSLGIAGYAGFICYRVINYMETVTAADSSSSDDDQRRAA